MYKRILVPIDGSEIAHEALETACALAEQHSAKIILLCVTDKDIPEEVVKAAINEGIVRPTDYQDFAKTLVSPEMATTRATMTRNAILARTGAWGRCL